MKKEILPKQKEINNQQKQTRIQKIPSDAFLRKLRNLHKSFII